MPKKKVTASIGSKRSVTVKNNETYIDLEIEGLLLDCETVTDLGLIWRVKYDADSIGAFKDFIIDTLFSHAIWCYLDNSCDYSIDINITAITRDVNENFGRDIVGKHEREILAERPMRHDLDRLNMVKEAVIECINDAVRDIGLRGES